ncbi:unnamed protein product [Orchesella dallaii]|uniref:O-acyltransferase WSD1 C-terminal domain-containing protein n=1 Tax=Orchesella dallaii TaxID=48710 RepID=A0ABP1S8I8_9HEXA
MELGLVPLLISLLGYIFLGPVVTALLIVNEILRIIVSYVLLYNFNDKIVLVSDGAEAAWAAKRAGKSNMVQVTVHTEQPITEEKCIEYITSRVMLEMDPLSGQKVNEKLEHILIEKYGYACWKKDEDFNVKRHVRYLGSKIYCKPDMQSLFREISEDMGDNKPQWELVIVPRYKESKESPTTCLTIFRFHHAYADGLSVLMIVKKHFISDVTYYLDPCELPVKIPPWKIYLYYANAIIFGPYTWLLVLIKKFRSFWPIRRSPCPVNEIGQHQKHFTWANRFDLDKIRKIRKTIRNATISSIIENAFITAATQVLPRERFPENWFVTELAAFIPYKNTHPQNRFSLFEYYIDSTQNEIERLECSSNAASKAMLSPYIPVLFFLIKLCGRFPICINKYIFAGALSSMMVSNVPISKTKGKFVGTGDVLEFIGFPPQPTDIGITVGCSSYNNSVKITACSDPNWLGEEELEGIVGRIPGIIAEWADKIGSKTE